MRNFREGNMLQSRIPFTKRSGESNRTCWDLSSLDEPSRFTRRHTVGSRRTVLMVLLVGINIVATCKQTSAQAQIAKIEGSIKCGDRIWEVGLVSAKASVKGRNGAKALGIVLLPPAGTQGSKVFCVYWIGDSTEPTHRDDTNGTASAFPYNNGKTSKGVDVLENFFASLLCPADDVKVKAIQNEVRQAKSDITLDQIKQALLGQGITLNVLDSKDEDPTPFANLQNEPAFANAVHQFISTWKTPVLKDDGEADKKAIEQLTVQKSELEKQIESLKKKSDSGNVSLWPIWLALIGVAAAWFVLHIFYRRRKKTASEKAPEPTRQLTEGESTLVGLIQTSRNGYLAVKSKYGEVIQQNHSQGIGGKSYDELLLNAIKYGSNHPRDQKQKVYDYFAVGSQCNKELLKLCDDLYIQVDSFLTSASPSPSDGTDNRAPGDGKDDSAQQVNLQIESGGEPLVQSITFLRSDLLNWINELDQRVAHDISKLRDDQAKNRAALDQQNNQLITQIKVSSTVQKGLLSCWALLSDASYDDAKVEWLFGEIKRALHLCRLFAGVTQNPDMDKIQREITNLKNTLETIRHQYLGDGVDKWASMENIASKLKNKLQSDAAILKKIEETNSHLGGDVFTIARDLKRDQSNSLSSFKKFAPSASSLLEAAIAIGDQYTAMAASVKSELPTASGDAAAIVGEVNELARQHKVEKDGRELAEAQLTGGTTLALQVATQLNFNVDRLENNKAAISLLVTRLSREQEISAYQQLRMGLSAGLITLDKAMSLDHMAEERAIIHALNISEVRSGLRDLLREMEEYFPPHRGNEETQVEPAPGVVTEPEAADADREKNYELYKEKLWAKGLYNGFNQGWLHYLFRADLLMRTYFTGGGALVLLQEAIGLASSAAYTALCELGVEITRVRLLEPLPIDIPAEGPVYENLRSLSAVKEKICRELEYRKGFVIDVTSFPIYRNGDRINPGNVVQVNPAAWFQDH